VEKEGHLSVLTWDVVVVSSDGVHLLHEIRVIDLVAQVVVRLSLMPIVLRDVGRVEIG
jgi:hypothetical protein